MPDSRAVKGAAVQFGIFEVDICTGELRKRGVKVKLQEQPFLVLTMLLEHSGQIVTRDDLRQRLWPADTFVDFDHGLNNAVKRLREALGDVAETPRFIETIPKRGYRFIGSLTSSDDTPPMSPDRVPGVSAVSPRQAGQTRSSWRNYWVHLLVAAASPLLILCLLIGLNADGIGTRVRAAWSKPPQIHSLAVLPLKNLSDDPAQEYFSYGMTEELITDVAQISGLKVISHTSVLQYAKTSKPLPQIARELGVDAIVEGTVQRSGERVRITAQLIYAPEEQHLWAASYDRDLRDALTLESTVAAAIVEPIRARTASAQVTPRKTQASPSMAALEDYLHGKYAREQIGAGVGIEGYDAAVDYLKRAIAEDPNFAPAYVELAHTYDSAYAMWPNEKYPLEKALVAKALELDPESAEAHLMSANLKNWWDCDLKGEEKDLREAVRVNPNLSDAHSELSTYLESVGRLDEARAEADRAKALDPEKFYGLGPSAGNGQYDREIEEIRKHLELHPDDGYAYIDSGGLIDLYHFAGRHRESIEAMQRAWTLFGFNAIGQGLGKAYATSGYQGALRYSAKQMERLYAEHKVSEPNWIAMWYARSGDKEQALKWVGISLADNNYCWADLYRDPNFTSLHSDSRFQELVKRSTGLNPKPTSF